MDVPRDPILDDDQLEELYALPSEQEPLFADRSFMITVGIGIALTLIMCVLVTYGLACAISAIVHWIAGIIR